MVQTKHITKVEDVLTLLQKVERVGAEPADILHRAGVPYSPQDLANGSVEQVDRQQLVAIYRECIVAIGWHSSQLDRKPQMHPDEFRLMCHCIITSRTFREVIERQSMFFRTRQDRLSKVMLIIDGPMATISVDTLRLRKGFSSFLSDLAGMSIFSRLYGWLLGIDERPFRVGLTYGPEYANEMVSDFFSGHLQFGCPVNSLSFPSHFLAMPIVRTPDELDGLLIDFPFDFLSAAPSSFSLPDRIRTHYAMSLARGTGIPTLDQLANLTGRSVSSLRRHLADENVSIRSLKEEAQKASAMEALKQNKRKIEQIAFRIGFRDTNSFRTAFRRWTGMTPSDFRSRQRGSGASGTESELLPPV